MPRLPLLALTLLAASTLPAVEPLVRFHGAQAVAADGTPVTLRGVNLGCWLLLEPWMLRVSGVGDQESLVRAWRKTLGDAGTADFRTRLRRAWITAEDLAVVRRCGFNTVRIPFDSRPLMAETGPIVVDPAGFAGLDEAMALAEAAGLHIIIDLHGAPGGQNDDQPTGERGRNALWTDPVAQQRTAAIWAAVATRYRDRPHLIAYDLINEPYGSGHGGEATAIAVMDQSIKAIRAIDPDRLIYVPGTSAGVLFYGDPKARGWTNTGYTEHYYPGLYGAPETVEVHRDFLARFVPAMGAALKPLDVPFLVGEFNPVVASAAAPVSTRAHFDGYARQGWAATLWSLRWLTVAGGNGPSDWCLVGNRDPLPKIAAATATAAEWEAWLAVVAGPRAVNEGMVQAFATGNPPPFPLEGAPPVAAPATGPLPEGWTAAALGASRHTSAGIQADGSWRLVSAGRDLHVGDDAALFLHRPATGPAWTASLRITTLEQTGRYAKGGLMLRQSVAADAPFVAVHAFPDGRACLAVRSTPGGKAAETILTGTALPLDLRLSLRGGTVTAEAKGGAKDWTVVGSAPWTFAAGQSLGVIHCANSGVVPGELVTTPVEVITNSGD